MKENTKLNKKWYGRLATLSVSGVIVCIGLALIMKTFNDNIVFFYTPSELTKRPNENQVFRVGGLVKEIKKNGTKVEFIVTDVSAELKVVYEGLLPALFKEGQGAVALGSLSANGIFVATEILAKHDENYMPRELQNNLQKQGYWRENN